MLIRHRPPGETVARSRRWYSLQRAKNLAATKLLYDELMSKDVQEALLVKNFRRPTRTDIAVSKLTSLPDLNSIKIFPLNQDEASAEYEQLVALWNQAVAKAR